jgi:MYXO-CTERM domain-containing protein
MRGLSTKLAAGGVALGVVMAATPGHAVIDLGFLLDSSGSITAPNWNNVITPGLADALQNSGIPTDSTYRVSVFSFSDSAQTVVAPTLIDSAAALTGVTTAIASAPFQNSTTDLAEGFDLVGDTWFGGLVDPNDIQLLNVVSDGLPNNTAAATASAADLQTLGVDGLSAEFIGEPGSVGFDFLQGIVFPNPPGVTTLTDPLTQGFILEANFQNFGDVIAAKVQQIVGPPPDPNQPPTSVPEPGLLGVGLLGVSLFARRRRQV